MGLQQQLQNAWRDHTALLFAKREIVNSEFPQANHNQDTRTQYIKSNHTYSFRAYISIHAYIFI